MKVQLQGFNNLTKAVSVNLYDFKVAATPEAHEKIWQTHMMKNITDPQRYFYGPIREDMLTPLRKDMQEVFYGIEGV